MKKSIRVAAALCAVVVGLSALLAGCGNGDDEEPSGGPSGLGGHVGKNPFKGLTLVSEDKDSYRERTETYTFTSDTKGVYRYERLDFEDDEDSYVFQEDFEYAVDSDRNMLKLRITSRTEDGETQTLNDKLLAETYGKLDDETKSLIYDSFIDYIHYDFTDDGTGVELDPDYYFGSMAESSAYFEFYDNASRVEFEISNRMSVAFSRDGWFYYECYPKFTDDGSFTAVVFKENEIYNADDDSYTYTYDKLSTRLAGNCQITGTGTNCTGTVTFTQIPDEMKAGDDGKGLIVGEEYTLSHYSHSKSYTIQK